MAEQQQREPGAPQQIDPQGPSDYLAVMSKAVLQTGMSWTLIDKKWTGILAAFHDFDAEYVATLGDEDMSRLMQDTRVIRNRPKLEAIRENARRILDLDDQHGTFKAYLESFGDFELTVKDLRKRFKFLGDSGAYVFLYIVRQPVPAYDDWCASRGRTHMHSDSH